MMITLAAGCELNIPYLVVLVEPGGQIELSQVTGSYRLLLRISCNDSLNESCQTHPAVDVGRHIVLKPESPV